MTENEASKERWWRRSCGLELALLSSPIHCDKKVYNGMDNRELKEVCTISSRFASTTFFTVSICMQLDICHFHCI